MITLISNTSIELLFPWFMFTEKIKCIFPLGREPDVMHQIEVRYVGQFAQAFQHCAKLQRVLNLHSSGSKQEL